MKEQSESPLSSKDVELSRLIRRCSANDQVAWNNLLNQVRQQCLITASRKFHMNRDDAEDFAQAVQVRVVERLPQLRDPQAFTAWSNQLMRRTALDRFRERRPSLSLEDDGLDTNFEADPQATEVYDRVALRADLDRALSKLPEHYRTPILLHLLEGIPQDEVGRALGRSRNTIASQIDRGLRRLRQTLPPSFAG